MRELELSRTGYCQCGCGKKVGKVQCDGYPPGTKRGDYRRFVSGHNKPAWKGGKYIHNGYVTVHFPGHPRSGPNGYVREHILVIEKALGKYLRKGAVPHHVNEKKSDNRNVNLVACDSPSYHWILQCRTRALKSCGHAAWKKCAFCKRYDDPKDLRGQQNKLYHLKCKNETRRKRRKEKTK